jgi:putative ABC transport system permease protein
MSLSTEAEDKLALTPARKPGKARRPPRGGLPGIITLAGWRVRETWKLLVVTGLGIIAAVLLVCSVPLYSDVSMSAGLRGVLSTSYQASDIVVQAQSPVISSTFISKATQELNAEFQNRLGAYLGPLEFSVQTASTYLLVNQPTRCSGMAKAAPYFSCDFIQFISASMQQARSHIHLVAGALPGTTSDGKSLDIALTDESARNLHATVGSLLLTNFTASDPPNKDISIPLILRVVGIITPPPGYDPFWHGNTYVSVPRLSAPGTAYVALTSNEAIISLYNQAFQRPELHSTMLDAPLTLQWY